MAIIKGLIYFSGSACLWNTDSKSVDFNILCERLIEDIFTTRHFLEVNILGPIRTNTMVYATARRIGKQELRSNYLYSKTR